MQGMNRNTGRKLSGVDHLRQSIVDNIACDDNITRNIHATI
jgi:phage baseplate assembly protein W